MEKAGSEAWQHERVSVRRQGVAATISGHRTEEVAQKCNSAMARCIPEFTSLDCPHIVKNIKSISSWGEVALTSVISIVSMQDLNYSSSTPPFFTELAQPSVSACITVPVQGKTTAHSPIAAVTNRILIVTYNEIATL